MTTIQATETIDAPIERVFDIASDIPGCAERIAGINRVEVLEEAPAASGNNGPVGMGFKWREWRTMFGKEATEDMWITGWSPPHSYQVEARSHGCHYLSDITFADVGDGRTTMTWSFNATPETLLAKVMMKVFAFMNKKLTQCLVDDLADLRRAAESSG
ncbi:MAG: SRPBCC family protein [Planctomycetota bacterium]